MDARQANQLDQLVVNRLYWQLGLPCGNEYISITHDRKGEQEGETLLP